MAKNDGGLESAVCGIGCMLIVIVAIIGAIATFVKNHPVISSLIIIAILAIVIISVVQDKKKAGESEGAVPAGLADPALRADSPGASSAPTTPGSPAPLGYGAPLHLMPPHAGNGPGVVPHAHPSPVVPLGETAPDVTPRAETRQLPEAMVWSLDGSRSPSPARPTAASLGNSSAVSGDRTERSALRPVKPASAPVPVRRPNPWEQMTEMDLRILVAGLLEADGWRVDHEHPKTWREFVVEDPDSGRKLVVKCVANARFDDEGLVDPERVQAVSWRDTENERLLVFSGRSPRSTGRNEAAAESVMSIVDSDALTRWNDGEAEFRSGAGLIPVKA
ncbi:hypothetical protein [Brachybacterium phenoliresistens]|uniref:hypothetical protein n=1 Tax=Brachybacterium phenoliresistens TaxID=396014 RepID=UPI0031DECEE3